MLTTSRKKGDDAEAACRDFLQSKGLRHLSNNYSCRYGELDLIMLDSEIIVFIEVRYRKDESYGGAASSVTLKKQQKVRKTAEHYLQTKNISRAARIDVVAMSYESDGEYTYDWIKDAF